MSQMLSEPLPSSLAILDLLLAALDAPDPAPLGGNNGLPAHAVDCLEHNLVFATTPITGRIFDAALTRYAEAHRRDVVLVRSGLHPETLDPVRIDVALRASFGGAILVPDLSLWRGADGTLNLVPDRRDLFVTVAGHGLDVLLVAPWDTLEERSEGLERAAAQVVRACTRARSGW